MIERFFEVAIVDKGGAVELAPVEGSLVLGLRIKQKVTGAEVVVGSRGDLLGFSTVSVLSAEHLFVFVDGKLRDRALDEAESLFLSDPIFILEGEGSAFFRVLDPVGYGVCSG